MAVTGNPPVYLIVNPNAGAGKTARRWPSVQELLTRLGLRFEHALTEGPGHAAELAAEAAKRGFPALVAVGGDGTLHEVVNGLWRSGALDAAALGILSTGTGSDYLRSTPLPANLELACLRLLAPLTRRVDLGLVRYQRQGQPMECCFINIAGIGFDAEVVRNTTQKYKVLGTTPSYLLGLLTTFINYRAREVTLTIDGKAEPRRVFTVMMAKGKYGGGGMMMTPGAEIDNGLLEVMVIGNINALDLISQLRPLYRGTHVRHPKVYTYRAKMVEITPARPMALQVDGELLGEAPATFSVLPGALNLIV